jgi:hypothetical protein
MTEFSIPNLSLVVLIGPSGSGKSTFARKPFLQTEVLSSDYCRGLVSDDENKQAATTDAFEVLHYIAAKRLAARAIDGRRCDQCSARGPATSGGVGQEVSHAAGRDCLQPAGRRVPGTEPRSGRP